MTERVNKADQVANQVEDSVRCRVGRAVRVPVAPHVWGDDVVPALGQVMDLVLPCGPDFGEAMDEQSQRPISFLCYVHPYPIRSDSPVSYVSHVCGFVLLSDQSFLRLVSRSMYVV